MTSDPKRPTLSVACPLCQGTLTIDPDTGAVLHAAASPSRGERDFDAALGAVRTAASQHDENFTKAFKSEQQRAHLLDKKFEVAKEKATSTSDAPPKPRHPFDRD